MKRGNSVIPGGIVRELVFVVQRFIYIGCIVD